MGDPCTTASLDVPADSPQTYDGLTFYGVRQRCAASPRPLPPPLPPAAACRRLQLPREACSRFKPDPASHASPGHAARVQHMVAGAVAGIGEHVAMYPVDTVKTRMQALAHPGQQVGGGPGWRVDREEARPAV